MKIYDPNPITAKITGHDIKVNFNSTDLQPKFNFVKVKIEGDLNNQFPYSFPFSL